MQHRDTGTRPRPRALVVEDDRDARELYAWCLRAAGWVVQEVTTGSEAVVFAETSVPDVIIMDLCLPVLGGLEAARLLKQSESTRNVPIVACTAVDPARMEPLAREAGCDAFLAKPLTPESLQRVLEELLGRETAA